MITVCHFIAMAGDFIKYSSVVIIEYQVHDTDTIEDISFRNLKEIISTPLAQ